MAGADAQVGVVSSVFINLVNVLCVINGSFIVVKSQAANSTLLYAQWHCLGKTWRL